MAFFAGRGVGAGVGATALWFWFVLAFGLGALVLAGLSYNIPLLQITVLCGGILAISILPFQPPYRVVAGVLFFAMFLNLAAYSFLSYGAGGMETNSQAGFITYFRQPLVWLAVGLVLMKQGRTFLRFLRLNGDVVIFGLATVLSALFAFKKTSALLYGLWMLGALLTILAFLCVLGTRIPRQQWSERIAWLLLAANLPMILLVVPEIGSYQPGSRLQAAFSSNRPVYAYSCVVSFVALLVLERQRGHPNASRFLRNMPTAALTVAGIAVLVPLLLSAKRSAILVAALGLVVYTFSTASSTGTKKSVGLLRTVTVAAVMAVAAWYALTVSQATQSRFERLSDEKRNTSVTARFEIIENGLDVYARYPVFGVGLLNGREATKVIAPYSVLAGYGLHNTYLGVLVETGTVGALVFLVLLFRSYRLFRRISSSTFKADIVLLALPGVLISVTEYSLTPGQALFWPLWITLLLPRIALVSRLHKPKRRVGRPRSTHPAVLR